MDIKESKFNKTLQNFLKGDKTGKIILIIGIIGIIFIFLSSVFDTGDKKEKNNVVESTSVQEANISYVNDLQLQVENVVTSMTGTKDAEVLITIDNGYQYVYADQTSSTYSSVNEEQSGIIYSEESGTSEQQYIILESSGEGQQPLLITEVTPSIKGVVIVCENGDNADTQVKITDAVSTALGISRAQVCVVGK